MLKRVFSIFCIFVLILTSFTVSLAELPPSEQRDEEGSGSGSGSSTPSAGTSMYVYTANGKTLHLREKGKSNAKILREIPWGARVSVVKASGSWTKITYDGTTGYVVTKYLVSKRPTRKPSSGSSKKSADAKPTPIPVKFPESLNGYTDQDLDSSDMVTLDAPEDVTVEPPADDENVPMFSKMSLKSKMLYQYVEGDYLLLIAKNEDWGKVTDPSGEKEGYMLLDWLVSDLTEEEELD